MLNRDTSVNDDGYIEAPNMGTSPARVKAVAYHEAGHAVGGWLFGLPVARVAVWLSEDGTRVEGETLSVDWDVRRRPTTDAHRTILARLAAREACGPIAEYRSGGLASPFACAHHANTSRAYLRLVYPDASDVDLDREMMAVWRRAHDVMEQYWPAVAAVAEAVATATASGELLGDAIESLAVGATGIRPDRVIELPQGAQRWGHGIAAHYYDYD